MNKDLEAKIEERKQEAIRKKLYERVKFIGEILGDHRKEYMSDDGAFFEDRMHHEVNTGTLYIDYNEDIHMWGHKDESVLVKENNAKGDFLFRAYFEPNTLEIKVYIPGKWEKKLDELYNKALAVSKQRTKEEKEKQRKREAEKEAKKRKKWGLEEEPKHTNPFEFKVPKFTNPFEIDLKEE